MVAMRNSANADVESASKKQIISLTVILFIKSKWPLIANAELETSAAAVGGIGFDWDAVIQPQRTKVRDVQAQAKAPIIVVDSSVLTALAETVRLLVHHPDVIEQRKPQPLNNRNAVFDRAEPVSAAADWLVLLFGTDVTKAI